MVDGNADGGSELLGDTGFLFKPCKLPAILDSFSSKSDYQVHTFSSAMVKPRPALTRRLYLTVGQRTTGRSLSTGRGATLAAFARRAERRLCLRPGYSGRKLVDYSQSSPPRIDLPAHSIMVRFRKGYEFESVPGRSTRAHDAASPCGSLKKSVN